MQASQCFEADASPPRPQIRKLVSTRQKHVKPNVLHRTKQTFRPDQASVWNIYWTATRNFIFDHRLTAFVFIGVMSRIIRAQIRQTIILDQPEASQSTSERQSFLSAFPTIHATSTTKTCQPQTCSIPSQSQVAEKDSLRTVSGKREGPQKLPLA